MAVSSLAEAPRVASDDAAHITPERSQLTALRRVARGTVYGGRKPDEFIDGEHTLPEWIASGMASAVRDGYVVLSVSDDPAGLAQRAELTVGGFVRIAELVHQLDHG